MSEFREFVKENEIWFRGRLPETDDSLDRVERELGVTLPEDIRWLLKEYGYWHGTGISNIEESVDDTKLAREHVYLPLNYVVLYDHQDGGVILLDVVSDKNTGKNRIINSAWESIPEKMEEEIIYPSITAYTKSVIEIQADFLNEEDIECKE